MAVMLGPVERSGRQPDDRPSVQFQPPILCNFTPPLTGNAECGRHHVLRNADHPRACGERSQPRGANHARLGSSPRVRGTQQFLARRREHDRIIPARAGNALAG
jgi:hypothetical protein